jgi:uncharacterized membrane protein YbaN (DUF454 family)
MAWNGVEFVAEVPFPEIVDFEDERPWQHQIVQDVAPGSELIVAVPPAPAPKGMKFVDYSTGLRIHCDKGRGSLQVVDPRMIRTGREAFCQVLCAAANSISGASTVDLDLSAHSCRFQFEPGRLNEAELASRVVLAIKAATAAMQMEASVLVEGLGADAVPEPAMRGVGPKAAAHQAGPDRRRCVALGGGSLLAGAAGLVLPGIPTAPFLLLSAHYFMKSSAAFRRWLDRTPEIADLVRKFETSGETCLSRSFLVKTLGMAILLGALFVLVHPPLPLVMAIEFGLTAFFGIRELADLGLLSLDIPKVFP